MKIFLIEQDSYLEYDCMFEHVIVANTVEEVISLAKEYIGDEPKTVWDKAKITTLGNYTGFEKKTFVVLSNFNAG